MLHIETDILETKDVELNRVGKKMTFKLRIQNDKIIQLDI